MNEEKNNLIDKAESTSKKLIPILIVGILGVIFVKLIGKPKLSETTIFPKILNSPFSSSFIKIPVPAGIGVDVREKPITV